MAFGRRSKCQTECYFEFGHYGCRSFCLSFLLFSLLTLSLNRLSAAQQIRPDYGDALSKSLLFLEAQRSGKLPKSQRVTWRGDSALNDGSLLNVNLVGGYYDAGDNVKYGFPMAFTVTTLSWSALQYAQYLGMTGQKTFVRSAIKWGTDYLLKASRQPNRLYYQVGDALLDHQCWERPEDMDTPRTVYVIDESNPGTEVVAETAAALAAASIIFKKYDPRYYQILVNRSQDLFEFALSKQQTLQRCNIYCSVSGYQDELQWAAAWLYRTTRDPRYRTFAETNFNVPQVTEFSWDLKYAGVQVLLAELYYKGRTSMKRYNDAAQSFICAIHPESPLKSATITPGGMLFVREGANTQYVTSASLLFSVYSDILQKFKQTMRCGYKTFTADDVMSFAKQQVDYLLGNNPLKMSYMVAYGNSFPQRAHHRGASIPRQAVHPTMVKCGEGFVEFYASASPNPNLLTGAVVGGPNQNDSFEDLRTKSVYTEPCTYVNSCLVGVLAKLAVNSASA